MKLAFIDYVFSWPPLGGAPADLYYTMTGLQAMGHEVHLFYGAQEDRWFLQDVAEAELPFPATRIGFPHGALTPDEASSRYKAAIDHYRPDVIFQCFGFFIKPFVSLALSDYPQICRYYAYEPMCPRDYRLFKDWATCPNNYLRTPNECRRCTLKTMWRSIRTGRPDMYTEEFLATKAYSDEYYRAMMNSLRAYNAIIVYNQLTRGMLSEVNDNIHVIGGGVHVDEFDYTPLEAKPAGEKTIILMTGRADDASKGTKTLERAGEILSQERDDFEIWLTHPDQHIARPWFRPIGWHSFAKMKQIYKQADICVVPSIWEEPFGLVAVEAMATGRPAVVSDVGGLQEIVVPGETGDIFPRGNAEALAAKLRPLLDDPQLRRRMGDAGRKRVEENYDWKQVIEQHYPPILEAVKR
jgi:glycosyltransferase involved in cell wall biosynthesis